MSDIDDIVSNAIAPKLPLGVLSRVMVRPAVDSSGLDAWAVTVVLNDDNVDGHQALRAIVAVQEAFECLGDDRIPIVDFAMEHELNIDVGSEA